MEAKMNHGKRYYSIVATCTWEFYSLFAQGCGMLALKSIHGKDLGNNDRHF